MRKNIGDLFSVIRRLLRSKRALYLVNTSEEFLFFNRSNGVVVVSQAILHANNQFHSIVCIFYTQTCYIVTETIIFINLFFIFNLSNEDRPSYKFWNKSNGLEMNMAFRIVPGYFLGSLISVYSAVAIAELNSNCLHWFSSLIRIVFSRFRN